MHWVASSGELTKLAANHKQLLALGMFPWSNYSRETQLALTKAEPRFNAHEIGLAAFELGELNDVARVCPPFLRYFLFAVTEPACLLLRDGVLVAVRFGRATEEEVLAWALSAPALPPAPNLSGHPHPEFIAPLLKQAVMDEEASVREVADELLRELNWSEEVVPAKVARPLEPARWWKFWK